MLFVFISQMRLDPPFHAIAATTHVLLLRPKINNLAQTCRQANSHEMPS